MRRKDREVTNIEEIENIIRQCKTCHVAMADDGVPYVVPLSYGYKFLANSTLELYFHSALEGKKLDILRKSNKVCFEISCEGELIHADTPCGSGYYFSSVIGYGEAVFIGDTAEKSMLLSAIFKHQLGEDVIFNASQTERVCIYKIVSSDFTGKRKPRPAKK